MPIPTPPVQLRLVDEVEVRRPVAHSYPLTIRVAFEVADTAATTTALEAGGATIVAPPTLIPGNSVNSRLDAPGGLQVTAFQGLGPVSSWPVSS